MKNLLKIENCKLSARGGSAFGGKIILLSFALCALSLFLLPSETKAGVIIQRPLYIGLTNGLVGLWTFDAPDMAGVTSYDRSGQGNNGTLTNGPTRQIGKIGQALNFDGVNDYVNAGSGSVLDNIVVAGGMTVSAWIYPRSEGEFGAGAVAAKTTNGGNNGWTINFRSAGTNALEFNHEYSTTNIARAASNNSVTLNSWQHILITWDGSTSASNVHIFINGVETSYQLTTNGDGTKDDDNLNILGIGARDTGALDFDGLIDEVRVYNRALAPDEIKRLYNMGATTKFNVSKKQDPSLNQGLVGLWTFDAPDMAGVAAYDRSGQGNNGTLTNGPTRQIGKIGQALNFDGVDDRVDLNTAIWNSFPTDNTAFTISYWFKADTLPAQSDHIVIGTPISSGIGSFWTLTAGATLIGQNFDNVTRTQITIGTVVRNKWYHVVYTYDGTTQRGYLDGVASAGTATGDWTSARSFAAIGYQPTTAFFDGLIDEVRVYNRALSPDEIKRLYNMGR